MSAPTKQQVRDFMQQRRESHTPPPSPAEIRRVLGWHLVGKAPEVPR